MNKSGPSCLAMWVGEIAQASKGWKFFVAGSTGCQQTRSATSIERAIDSMAKEWRQSRRYVERARYCSCPDGPRSEEFETGEGRYVRVTVQGENWWHTYCDCGNSVYLGSIRFYADNGGYVVNWNGQGYDTLKQAAHSLVTDRHPYGSCEEYRRSKQPKRGPGRYSQNSHR